jgi:two-component system sensor histidine kinase/response regulator
LRHRSDNTEQALGHILVAEDDLVVQLIVKKMLEQAGYTLDLVADGQAAITALETRHYDLILMDCLMPRMDGFEATRAIRSTDSGHFNPGIPVIAMTGLTGDDDQARCFEAGMDSIASKPFDPHTLVTVIQQCLERPENTKPDSQHDDMEPQKFWEDDFFDSVINEFLADLPRVISDLEQAISQRDMVKLRNVSHRFRGATDILKASRLSALSKSLEKAAHDRETQLAIKLALELIEELQKLRLMLSE